MNIGRLNIGSIWRRGCLAAALVGCLALTGAASAATPSIRIASPATGALVTGKRLVVRAQVGKGTSHVRIRVAGRGVKAKRAGGGTLVATRPLRGLPGGRVTVTVRGRRHGHGVFASRIVVVGHRSPALISGVKLPRHAAGVTDLHLRLRGSVSGFRLKVDGKRAKLLRPPTSGRPVTLPLSADDGLRQGRNRVTVLAWSAKTGRWDRAARTVTMAPGVPLAAAGDDRRATVATVVRLDGTNSRPAHQGERLHYDWHIVSQPSVPKSAPPAKLLDPHAVRPRLVMHRGGPYKVALSLDGAKRPGSAAAGRRSPEASASSVTGAAPTSDVVTVEASIPVGPYGIHLSTGPVQGGAEWQTKIEGDPLERIGNGSVEAPKSETQLTVLNRETLAVVSAQLSAGPLGCTALGEQAINAYGAEMLEILTSPAGNCTGPRAKGFTAVYSGHALIAENAGNEIGGGAPGAIGGYLRRVHGPAAPGDFTFVFTQALEFDTYVQPGESGPVSAQVGGKKFPYELGGAARGIAITALNPALERIPSLSGTFPLAGNGEEVGTLAAVTHRLEAIVAEDHGGALLFQTLGAPTPNAALSGDVAAWESLGNALSGFGGTPAVWDDLDGTGNYALVGTAYGSEETAARRSSSTLESSEPMEAASTPGAAATKWLGTARGVLGLGFESLPVIRVGSSLPPAEERGELLNPGGLLVLAEAKPTPWPLTDAEEPLERLEYEEALADISENIGPLDPKTNERSGLGSPEGNVYNECFKPAKWDVRAAYCNQGNIASWGKYQKQVEEFACPTDEEIFLVGTCEKMKTELATEISDIEAVHTLIHLLQVPFEAKGAMVVTDFTNAADAIEKERINPNREMSGVPQSLIDGATTILQDTEFGIPGAAQIFGLFEAVINYGLESSEVDDEPANVPYFIKERAKLGTEAVARLEAAADGIAALEEVLLSDPLKLAEAADGTANQWGETGSSLLGVKAQVLRGAESWLWESLLPAAYGQIQVTTEYPFQPQDRISTLHEVQCSSESPEFSEITVWNPFKHVPENDVFDPPSSDNKVMWMIGNAGSQYAEVPSESLLSHIFEAPGSKAEGVGLHPAPFFTWNFAEGRKSLTTLIGEGHLGQPGTRCNAS